MPETAIQEGGFDAYKMQRLDNLRITIGEQEREANELGTFIDLLLPGT